MAKLEKYGEEKINPIEKLARIIKGKKVVIYGASWSGKTTLAIHLIPHLGATLYLDSDGNYPVEEMAQKLNAKILYKRVDNFVQAIKAMENVNMDAVIIDSMSGLIASLYEKEGVGSPRVTLLSAQYQERLIKLSEKFNTAIIITHVGADFRRQSERIRINQALLRYIDVIVKLDIVNGKRKIIVQKREPVEKPDFEF